LPEYFKDQYDLRLKRQTGTNIFIATKGIVLPTYAAMGVVAKGLIMKAGLSNVWRPPSAFLYHLEMSF